MSSSHVNFITLCGIYLLTTVKKISHHNPSPIFGRSDVPVWPLNPPNWATGRSLTVDFPTSKSITEMFPGKGWKTGDTDHPSYIVSHQSSQAFMKKPNILGIIEIPLKEKVVTLGKGMNVQDKCFEKAWATKFGQRWHSIYIYTQIWMYINILSSCYVILSFIWPGHRPFETIEYCAPTSLRRLVPFPAFPLLVNKHIDTILKQAFQVPNEQELKL